MNNRISLAAIAALLAMPALAQSHGRHGTNHPAQQAGGHGSHGASPHGQPNHAGHAASMLKSSTPADGAVLRSPPATLALSFAHPVLLQNVTLVNAAGKTTKVAVPAANAPIDTYQLRLPKLPKGAYTANWNAGGGDHLMSGRLGFEVK